MAVAILAGASQADAARVLEVDPDGRATVRVDPAIPAESPVERPRPAAPAVPGNTPLAAAAGASRLEAAVNAAAASGAIGAATRNEYLSAVARARAGRRSTR